jgi:mannose-6-phosphate isomerase-like protein (cupin superfamily)
MGYRVIGPDELHGRSVFVVLKGAMTTYRASRPSALTSPAGSMLAVQPGAALQLRTESNAEARLLAFGVPPQQGSAEFLPDAD